MVTGKIASSSRTIAHVRTRLQSILREAVTDQILYVSPAESVKPIKNRTENPHFALDFDQAARLHEIGETLCKAGVCRLWTEVFTVVSIGLRKSEVMALTWADVNLEKSILHIRRSVNLENNKPTHHEHNKTHTSRRDILMPASLKAALQRHKETQSLECAKAEDAWQDTNAVFTTATGDWVHPDTLLEQSLILYGGQVGSITPNWTK